MGEIINGDPPETDEERAMYVVCKMISERTGESPGEILMRIAKRAKQLEKKNMG